MITNVSALNYPIDFINNVKFMGFFYYNYFLLLSLLKILKKIYMPFIRINVLRALKNIFIIGIIETQYYQVYVITK